MDKPILVADRKKLVKCLLNNADKVYNQNGFVYICILMTDQSVLKSGCSNESKKNEDY